MNFGCFNIILRQAGNLIILFGLWAGATQPNSFLHKLFCDASFLCMSLSPCVGSRQAVEGAAAGC